MKAAENKLKSIYFFFFKPIKLIYFDCFLSFLLSCAILPYFLVDLNVKKNKEIFRNPKVVLYFFCKLLKIMSKQNEMDNNRPGIFFY